MYELSVILSWGSPVGIGLFLFLMGCGLGVFFWGISRLPQKPAKS